MKNLVAGITCLYLLFTLGAVAQENDHLNEPDRNKPRIFSDLPERMPIDVSLLTSTRSRAAESPIRLPLAGKVPVVQGRILSTTEKFNGALQTMIVKLDNRAGAIFTLSRITADDGSVTYRGRIVSRQAGDCYELTCENGTYILIKKDYNEMIME